MTDEARKAANRFLHTSIRTDDLARDIEVIGLGRQQAREACTWWASQVKAVKTIHIARPRLIWEITPSSATYPVCNECRTTYPCTTVKAIEMAQMPATPRNPEDGHETSEVGA